MTTPSFKTMTYNVENFSASTDNDRVRDVTGVIGQEAPEVLAVQEVHGTAAALYLQEQLNAQAGLNYNMAFDESVSRGQDVALLWRKEGVFEDANVAMNVIKSAQSAGNREILQVSLRRRNSHEIWHFFVLHLQASSGGRYLREREAEIRILREDALDRLIADEAKCVVLGDLNIYNSEEPAYKNLLEGGLVDPLVAADPELANWSGNNRQYAAMYTQATRDDRSGLDDRFDLVFHSPSVNVVSSSYNAVGNRNGEDFNRSVGDTRLRRASDHLPVVVSFYTTSPPPHAEYPVRFDQVVANPPGYDVARTEWFSLHNASERKVTLDGTLQIRKEGEVLKKFRIKAGLDPNSTTAFVFPEGEMNVLPNSGIVELALLVQDEEMAVARYSGASRPSTTPIPLGPAA